MDFELDETMAMLRDSAREFAEKRLKPGAQEWDPMRHYVAQGGTRRTGS